MAGDNIHIGSDTPPENANVWIDQDAEPNTFEDWKFTLPNGNDITKTVLVTESEEI